MDEAGNFIRRVDPRRCSAHGYGKGWPHSINCSSYDLVDSLAVLVGERRVMLQVWQRQPQQMGRNSIANCATPRRPTPHGECNDAGPVTGSSGRATNP